MHDCASILDSIAKGISLFSRFIASHLIPTSPFTQLNDFCTCFMLRVCVYTATCMRTCAYA